jgi:hypothetical protein
MQMDASPRDESSLQHVKGDDPTETIRATSRISSSRPIVTRNQIGSVYVKVVEKMADC